MLMLTHYAIAIFLAVIDCCVSKVKRLGSQIIRFLEKSEQKLETYDCSTREN
jgi:hypothetical protein